LNKSYSAIPENAYNTLSETAKSAEYTEGDVRTMTHHLLDTQLRECMGISPGNELASFLQAMQHAADSAVVDAKHVAALRGLKPLLDAVSANYSQADSDLKASEARFRGLGGISADWYWEQDKNYRFTAISSDFTHAAAIGSAQCIGKTWPEALGADLNAPAWVEHERMMRRHAPFRDFVFTCLGPDGDTIYLSLDGEPVFDANNRFDGYRGIARNITRHKRVENQLRETLRFTETLLDSMPYPVTVKDREHRFVRINSAHVREFGMKADAILGKTTFDNLGKAAEAIHAVEDQLIESPGVRAMTQTRARHTGEVRRYVVTKAAACDASGQVTGFITTHVDVTELKAAEARAEEQLRFTNVILENSPTPMMVKDGARKITYVNAAYEKLFNVRREDVFNREGRRQLDSQSISLVEAKDLELFAAPGKREFEHVLPTADGGGVSCIITKSTYPDAAGGIGGIVTTYTDISALKSTEERLSAAKQSAEAAMRIRAQFLANMSHEIRTPMNGVLGMTSLLHTTLLSREQREYVDTIKVSGEALLKIINDILDFSKIEAGKVEIEHTAFDLRSRLSAVTQLFAAAALERQLRLTSEVAADVPQTVTGDPVRIGQVLSNLVANAIKFTLEGGVHISVTVAALHAARLVLRFDVSDSGIGIDKAAADKIFNPFSQEDAGTTRRFGGTGLGLTIARELVELMDGELQVESTPGQGSRFSFTVALAAGGVSATIESSAGHASTDAQATAGAAMMEVLLAEDNKVNQLVATRILEKLGCKVTVAADGLEAVEQVSRRPFDLILMDCHMPNMDGFAATAAIRALEQRKNNGGGRRRNIIIAQTANAMEGDRETCLAAAMDDYVTKPYTSEKLAAVIKRWTPDLS
jgi:two-component system, sensor histidine kinase and response regulator